MPKLLLSILITLLPTLSVADLPLTGRYTTVSESECNYELILDRNGTGKFIDTCRREDGSHIDDIKTFPLTWQRQNNKLTIVFNKKTEFFTYHDKLPCHPFGEKGAGKGLVGYGTRFWKTPIDCQ